MSRRMWAPGRPQPVPIAGAFLSLTVHAAVLVSAATGSGGPASAGRAGGAPARAAHTGAHGDGRERLFWVGLGNEVAPDGAPAHAGGRPPVAYVIPGRGGLRVVRARPLDRHPRGAGPNAAPRASGADPRGDAVTDRPAAPPRGATMRARIPTLPEFVPPDADATLLVAGVLSAAPDLARRASPPDDFAHASDSDLISELGAEAIVRSMQVLGPPSPVHALPVALVSNPTPIYPAALVHARVGGHVVVEFTIDSTGTVDVGTLRVVRSTDVRFTEAVRRVLPQLRFAPAHRGARTVGVTVRQPFLFRIRAGG